MRVARLATADANGAPHVVPVCYALVGDNLYVTIDEKPKRAGVRAMKRLRNIDENPNVAVVVDRYDDDWSRLAWVMLRGRAEILDDGDEHDRAQAALRERYSAVPRDAARAAAGHRAADRAGERLGRARGAGRRVGRGFRLPDRSRRDGSSGTRQVGLARRNPTWSDSGAGPYGADG